MDLINIKYPVIVEGRYDKNRLCSVIRANIITTDGFGIFSKAEKAALIKKLSEMEKIIVLTDSDGAGTVIRGKISSFIPKDRIINLYIPKIKGKEKRKSAPSKEGTLGVEGMQNDLLRNLFLPFADGSEPAGAALTKADFYADKLTGAENSSVLRDRLAVSLGLPDGMNANALLAAVNLICTREEYESRIAGLNAEDTIDSKN